MSARQSTPEPSWSSRAVIYCRVSSSGQEDNSSLQTQEEQCRAYVAVRGWTVVAVYREVFETIIFYAALSADGNGLALFAGAAAGTA